MAAPMQAFGLACLPSELLKMIFGHLQQSSLLQVRLSCKAFSSQATPEAFKRITVWLEEGRLSDLVKISEQPYLAPHVRQISCGMEEFCDLSCDDFKMKIFLKEIIQGSTKPPVKDSEASWQVYHSYAVKQRHLDSSGQGHIMLCECFKAFPNLNSVEIHRSGSDWHDPEHGLRLLRQEPRLRHYMLLFYPPSLGLSLGRRQLSTMVKALAHVEKPIEHLSLQPFNLGTDGGGLVAPLNPYEEGLALAAFAGLRSIDLDLFYASDGRFSTSTPNSSSLSTIFQAAVDLKSLYLKIQSLSLLSKSTGLFKGISGLGGPRHLETLVIEGATLDQKHFVEFMRESGQNLQSLSIDTVLPKLDKVKIPSLWSKFQDGPSIVIRGPVIGGRIDDVDAQPLYDYLLRKSNVNPWGRICAGV